MSRSGCRSCAPRSTTARRSISRAAAAPIPAACARRSSLRSSSHRPRKRFGQHFLHDPRVLSRIVEAINPASDDFIVEIGPGQGALTAPLLKTVQRLNVIELDRDLAAKLTAPGLIVHEADALDFDFG